MAPFVDVNSDGQYDPLAGDYPKMKGQQMLWWIVNDNGPSHNVATSPSMNMELRISAYAYTQSTIADNIIFYDYELTNRSTTTWNNFRFGIVTDADLGYAFDDYQGFDPARRLGVNYNGKSFDGDGSGNYYGASIPMMGIVLLELPGDGAAAQVPAGGFSLFPNLTTAQAFYDHLGRNNPNSTYGFSLDSECVGNHQSGDRRFVIASNEWTFAPGDTKKIGSALVVCANGGGCPTLNFDCIREVADTARSLYHRAPAALSVGTSAGAAALRMYPNPATDRLHIETDDAAQGKLSIYDALGRLVDLPATRQGSTISITTSGLANGIYTVRYGSSEKIFTNRFVKE